MDVLSTNCPNQGQSQSAVEGRYHQTDARADDRSGGNQIHYTWIAGKITNRIGATDRALVHGARVDLVVATLVDVGGGGAYWDSRRSGRSVFLVIYIYTYNMCIYTIAHLFCILESIQ